MRIRKIEFENHPILGNTKLDFTDNTGKTINTIILAGENGTGKSVTLNTIFNFSNYSLEVKKRDEKRTFEIELSDDEIKTLKESENSKDFFKQPLKNNIFKIGFDYSITNSWNQISITAENIDNTILSLQGTLFIQNDTRPILKTIFSDVEINFTSKGIKSVTAKNIDSEEIHSERSNSDLSTEIAQLLIDIQNQDALELTEWARNNTGQPVEESKVDVRTKRFSKAFESIFPTKKFNRIENRNNQKEIVFAQGENEMTINELSSGEKQIVFRGSFLLKNKESSKGALILIDEPEISLHPTWQLKILTYFKNLFSSENEQTSQIIIATHSPFIIHNSNRVDDKVIVLKRNDAGQIITSNNPEFYNWTPEEKIKSAFNVTHILKPNIINVLLEGETDEKYYNKAVEIFGIDENSIDFKWIGRINENGNAENTGNSALNQAKTFFRANPNMLTGKVILLYDSDTDKPEETFNNLEIRIMPKNEHNNLYLIGIENLLVLPDDFDKELFYKVKTRTDKYGAESLIRELDKSKLCNYICDDLDIEKQKEILIKLNVEIEKLK
ncbi:putative ATP-binding protein involved in virulence [Ulvibacter sp. MAR_2010_11]|uniref:AAA family ATPase n=1 Tax=Ulvibacter sp. MAR_2010_11 TaxID=1250229 RepID=UPI000C2BB6F7|nr:ATP-binding protein [Ulvibacter sp. MAR_2010_11]PKA82789.1 putative ATP-binding protein involved in virulence [Ulvibacter sp. MAR_2010_11]